MTIKIVDLSKSNFLQFMSKYFALLALLTLPLAAAFGASYPISYEVSMPEPHTHYFEIKVKVEDPQVLKADHIDFKMATWTPGSYLIREYAKNIESLKATAGGKEISAVKTSKNTWKVTGHKGQAVEVSYRLYAFEISVRTNFLDASHGYINGAPTFLYVPQLMNKKHLVKIIPHASFSKVSVALPEVSKNAFEAENFDLLVDSPFEIGNHEILEFEALGVKHKIANYSLEPLVYDRAKVIEDYKKIVTASHSIFGGKHPCKEYLFIVHHLPGAGGGLEHLNSTTCMTSPDAYQNPGKYEGFLGLIAHEYFHLWNVKRLRPIALGPFDYENENYTNMLWVSEGFTSYYQSDILRRANIISTDRMLTMLAGNIGTIENQYGNKVQPVAESSWDAWIKYYRSNENSANSTVSYYNKGGVLANILNMIIISNTKGEKSLDDVLKNLYNNLYLKKDIGFTDQQFFDECSKVAGEDLTPFFQKYVFGTETIDYTKYFNMVDVDAKLELSNPGKPSFGAMGRGNKVARVDYGTSAYIYGINVNDDILEVDGVPFTNFEKVVEGKKVGDKINVTVLRAGTKITLPITLVQDPRVRINLKPRNSADPTAQKIFKKWMHL
ncbi:peptidase M61 domain protein [Leadbetterella byssophila DSM 17132]|uniref:Peptidase M61 domain protein n=2 Tax=Leadbetterella TaxID=319458 RepID=E4RRL5_LEAB4|nr:peptidase M61 domain protein [Leadbetterella byssophila DSM 17132]